MNRAVETRVEERVWESKLASWEQWRRGRGGGRGAMAPPIVETHWKIANVFGNCRKIVKVVGNCQSCRRGVKI